MREQIIRHYNEQTQTYNDHQYCQNIGSSVLQFSCPYNIERFELPALGHRNLPHIVMGDFNSHSTTWGYASTDNEGEAVEQWADSCDSTNMTLNSRKAWKTINKLSNDPTSSNPPCLVTANQVAHQLLVSGSGTMPSKPKRPVLPPATEGDTSKVYPFSEGEYNKGVAALKNNKAAGRDDILVEQLNHLGPKAQKWLLTMLNICFMENKIPTVRRQSKIIAILKPGKDSLIPKTYRPIFLLC